MQQEKKNFSHWHMDDEGVWGARSRLKRMWTWTMDEHTVPFTPGLHTCLSVDVHEPSQLWEGDQICMIQTLAATQMHKVQMHWS